MSVSKSELPSKRESELALAYNQNLQKSIRIKRLTSILAAGLCLVGGLVGATFNLTMTSFCLVVIGIIFLIRAWDANFHLDEVRRRSTKTLFPRMSVLEKKQESSTDQGPGKSAASGA